jgi:glycosyltransferase involved in cell wall biosynthesis
VTGAAPSIKPRVLLAFEPPDGGVAENAMQLALGLGRHGFEVEAAGPEEAIVYPRLEAAGVTINRLPFRRGYGRPAQDGAALAALLRLLRSRRYALVHCHSAKAGVLGRIAAALTRVPAVYSPHSLPFVGDFSELRRRFATATEKALAPATAALLCVCEAERRIALEHRLGSPDRVRVVYNGCEPCPEEVELDPALERLRAEGPVAAAVTVLREQKRPDIFLEAVPLVLERVPDARMALVGDGPLRDELHARAAALGLDAEPRFQFLPFAPPAARHLRALDVYVLPSAWEAFPIGVLEALACGTPQVATDVGGTAEAVVPETGVLVPPRDAPALAAAVADLLADSGRRRAMAQASRARHAERFGVERMVAETAALYREVLAR